MPDPSPYKQPDPDPVVINQEAGHAPGALSSIPIPTPVVAAPVSTPTSTPVSTPVQQDTTVPPTPTEYAIAKGDTLTEIAKKNGTNVQAILGANPDIKNPNVIGVGQKIKLPGNPTGTPATGTANKYQNQVLGAISKVPDVSNTNDVRSSAATVPYPGSELPPTVNASLDSLIGSLVPQIQATLNPDTHKTSLLDDYKQYSTDLGIDALNTEYMNLNNVINGSEDDIRSEVTKAGGFATESQIQGLTAARNKNLILKANGLQALITSKNDQLNTMIGLDESDRTTADDRVTKATNMIDTLASLQSTIQKNATDGYQKIVTNVGYQGLASALQGDPYSQGLAEKALGLPSGTLSNPAAVEALETYKQQTIAQGAQKIVIQQGNQDLSALKASFMDPYYSARTASSYASAINTTIHQLYPTNKNPIQTYNNSSQVINRVDEAYKLATDPKNKDKAAPDLDLVDSYVSVARGGQNISEAQVDTLLSGLGITAKFDVNTQKITGTATLDNGTRKSLYDLTHNIYDGQKKLAQQGVDSINQRLTSVGIPSNQLFTDPSQVGDTTQYSGGATINGTHYDVGQALKVGNITLTAQDDGTFKGSDGVSYDNEGNPIE